MAEIKNKLKYELIAMFLLLALLFYMDNYQLKGKITGNVITDLSFSIKPSVQGLFYENEDGEDFADTNFLINVTTNNTWFSYNGTFGGNASGLDFEEDDNVTEIFVIKNYGVKPMDILISGEDFDNNVTGDGNYINLSKDNGDFQIYLPQIAEWKNIPDNNNTDEDRYKDNLELCIVDDLPANETITDFDFRIRTSSNINTTLYISQLTFTVYDSSTYNPCLAVGNYVQP